jgi:hypothetical protein
MAGPARAGSFTPPVTLASGLASPEIGSAIDATGDALVAWMVPGTGKSTQKVRYRPAQGNWSASATIGPAGNAGQPPQLRFDAAGGATAITYDGANVWATDMKPGGVWGKPRVILSKVGFPLFTTDSAGNAAVVAGYFAIRRAAGAVTWSAPETLPQPPTGGLYQIDNVALGPKGDLLVPVETFDIDCARPGCVVENIALYALREKSPGAGWAVSRPLFGPTGPGTLTFASFPLLDQLGHAAIIFQYQLAVQAQTAHGGIWSAAVPVFADPPASYLSLIGATVDAQGTATVALLDSGATNVYQTVDGSIVGNAWHVPLVISGADPAPQGGFAFGNNAAGGVALAWRDAGGAIRVAARARAGLAWRPLETANPASCAKSFPLCTYADAVSINPAGQQVTAWEAQQSAGSKESVRAAWSK